MESDPKTKRLFLSLWPDFGVREGLRDCGIAGMQGNLMFA